MSLLMSCCLWGCGGLQEGSWRKEQVYINEVMTSNSFSLLDETLGSPDWIELHNPSPEPVNLKGYGLSDNIKEPHKWVFPSVTIPARGYLIVYAAKSRDSDKLCTGFGLSRGGEFLFLVDPYYNILQQLDIPELAGDISYARTSDGEYGYCGNPTPNAENDGDIFLSPQDGAAFAADGSALAITEVMPNNLDALPAGDGRYYPWAEVQNISSQSISLSDYYLSDSAASPTKWRFPGRALAPGEYALVFFSGGDAPGPNEMHASFKLGKNDSVLMLSNGKGSTISMFSWSTPIYGDISVTGPETYCAEPTPGGSNTGMTFGGLDFAPMGDNAPVRINELLKFNRYGIKDCCGDRSPWVELYNSSGGPVPLRGCFLSDDPEQPFKWAFPEMSIAAKSYLLIFLSGHESAGDELHTSFALSKRENALVFTDVSNMTQDLMELDPAVGENVSAGLCADSAIRYFSTPTPGAANSAHAFDNASEAGITTDMSGVYISEVCAAKKPKSRDTDWVELHNASDSPVDLKGWRLTDSAEDMCAFTFPSFPISPGGYGVVAASRAGASGVSAPFNISSSGETLILTDREGSIRDVFASGPLRFGVTSGRDEISPKRVFFTTPTKGAANPSASFPSYAAEPSFSETALYHDDAFSVEISCLTPGAAIYYTTDGSKPTGSAARYSGPIKISSNTTLKAVAAADGLVPSGVAAATYLFEKPHNLPVVCLSIDNDSFSEVYSVIDRWKKVEREGFFEYYETDGRLGVQFPCGLRVNGASTLTMRQKSLSIFLRGGYGQSSAAYGFFPGVGASPYTSLSIRNSGQDASKARMRDSFFSRAVEGLNIDNAHTRPVAVYINSRYWGLYDLNETQNEDYLAAHFGIDPDTVNIIRRNETPLAGDRADMYRVRRFARDEDISRGEKYEEFCQWVDPDYFTDYLIAQTYFSNGDMFNQKYWRTADYSIRWRPVYYDLDMAMGACSPSRSVLHSYFNPAGIPSQDGSLTNMDLFCGLRKNKGWCEKFGERYVYVAINYFNAERLSAILDEMTAAMEPEMERHIARWGTPSSVSAWKRSVNSLRSCLAQRQSYALTALQREFGFTDAQMNQWEENARAGSRQ